MNMNPNKSSLWCWSGALKSIVIIFFIAHFFHLVGHAKYCNCLAQQIDTSSATKHYASLGPAHPCSITGDR